MGKEVTIAKGKISNPQNAISANTQKGKMTNTGGVDYQRLQQQYGDRLIIHEKADKRELKENVRAAEALLKSFPNMSIIIREHVVIQNVKNPEYEINGLIADRKGIESEKGVSAGFTSAISQGCSAIVIDLDMKMRDKTYKTGQLSKHIYNRFRDFRDGIIKECYIVRHDQAIKITSDNFIFGNKDESKRLIKNRLDKIS